MFISNTHSSATDCTWLEWRIERSGLVIHQLTASAAMTCTKGLSRGLILAAFVVRRLRVRIMPERLDKLGGITGEVSV